MNSIPSQSGQATLFYRILSEHIDWLYQKGYQEKPIGSNGSGSHLSNQLQVEMQKAIIRLMWHNGDGHFSTKMTRRKVEFQFLYDYDPVRIRINFLKLRATLNKVSLEFPIENNTRWNLPPADKVTQELLALKKKAFLSRTKNVAQSNSTEVK